MVSVEDVPEPRSEVEIECVDVELSPVEDEDPDVVEVELLLDKDNELVWVELTKGDMLDEPEL